MKNTALFTYFLPVVFTYFYSILSLITSIHYFKINTYAENAIKSETYINSR